MKNITANKCFIKKISTIYDRNSRTKKVWLYNVSLVIIENGVKDKTKNELKSLGCYLAYTMRVPPKQFKKLSLKVNTFVKVLEYNNAVCAIFDDNGMGFMSTNIPFSIEEMIE